MAPNPTWAELESQVAAGTAIRDDVIVPSIVVGNSRLYRMDDGRTMDKFAKIRDYPGPDGHPLTVILEDKQGVQAFLEKARHGLAGLISILGSPAARVIGALAGIDVPTLESRVQKLGDMPPLELAGKLLREVTPRKSHSLIRELEAALDDHRVDEAEAQRIHVQLEGIF